MLFLGRTTISHSGANYEKSKVKAKVTKLFGQTKHNGLTWLIIAICALITSSTAVAEPLSIIEMTSDTSTLKFDLPELRFEKQELGNQMYDIISFDGSCFTYEEGKPQLPVYIKLLGIPAVGSPQAVVVNSAYETRYGYKLLPAQPQQLYPGNLERSDIPRSEETIQVRRYQKNAFYPKDLVEIEPIGYVREQRLARLKINPIQYNPVNGQLRVYKRMEIKITFPGAFAAPSVTASTIRSDSELFENFFKNNLINYNQSKVWRISEDGSKEMIPNSAMAPAMVSFQNPAAATYKLMVEKTGIYKVTQRELQALGADFTAVDPRTIKVHVKGDEVQIYVHGEQDGRFDDEDYILFYGKGLEDDKFTDTNVYMLSWGGAPGLRILTRDGTPKSTDADIPTVFKVRQRFEEDRVHDELVNVKSELVDHYFWTGFTGQTPNKKQKHIKFNLPKLVKGVPKKPILRMRFQGVSYRRNELHKASVVLNSGLVLTAQWNGQGAPVVESEFHPVYLSFQNLLTINCEDDNNTPPNEFDFMLDWFEVEYWRNFEAESGSLEFSSDTVPPVSGAVHYYIEKFTNPDVEVYQINDSEIVARIVNAGIRKENNRYTLVFEDNVAQPTRYYAVQSTSYMRVPQIEKDIPSNLRNPANKADYIIISHKDFIKEIETLAEHRRKQGLDVLIADIEDVYDEFSYGLFDPRAIKSFLRYAYHNWDKRPTYVLLVGDAHYDYKNSTVRMYREDYGIQYDLYPIFVPTYHSWSPEGGETAMDHKFVTVSGDDMLPDMAIGRLAVQTPSELRGMVRKIIAYEPHPRPLSTKWRGAGGEVWRSRMMQVADDEVDHVGDEEFEKSRERLIKYRIPVAYDTKKVYLRVIKSPGRTNKEIIDNINEGVVVLQYAGHGGSWTWADQNIFRGDNIQTLRNKGKYPFVITTTCLNGFFDKPVKFGEHSLSEEFLLGENRGAIASLSATRLTYAAANSAFDEELFTQMFRIKPPILGLIVLQSKVNFIAKHTPLWIPGAEQYTLFGDPATKLALPELEIITELEERSLDPSKELVIKHNIVGKYQSVTDIVDGVPVGSSFEKAADFKADMVVTVTYPNNLDDNPKNDIPIQRKIVPIWKGEFGDIRLDIPPDVISGDGIVRTFAVSGGLSAIGGAKFSIRKPVILAQHHQFTDDETALQISVELTDNKGVKAGIKKVVCYWYNTVDFKRKNANMIPAPHEGGEKHSGWYELEQPLPLPKGGQSIKYQIKVYDTEGNRIETEVETVTAPLGANIAIAQDVESLAPQIFYTFSQMSLSATLENNGGKPLKTGIRVYFFDGNPDVNGDAIIDEDAQTLGYAILKPEDWQPGSEALQTATAKINLKQPLTSGLHQIYVWADPELPGYDHNDRIIGKLEEPLYFDNRLSKIFLVNDFVMKKDEDLNAYSLDRLMNLFIPKGAIEPTIVSISSVNFPHDEQPDILPAPSPTISGKDAFKVDFQSVSDSDTFKKRAKLQFKFDVRKLREMTMKELNFNPLTQLTEEEEAHLTESMLQTAKNFSIYSYDEEMSAWRILPSKLLTDAGGDFEQRGYVTSAISQNSNPALLNPSYIKVDQSLTPTGEWIIFFLDDKTYEVLLKKEGAATPEKLERTGKIGEVFKDQLLGLQLNIPMKNDDMGNPLVPSSEGGGFEYGDTFAFKTYVASDGTISIANIRNYNYGDGSALIELLEKDEARTTFQVGNWLIFFRDEKRYELRDGLNQIVRYTYGTPVTGQVNKRLVLSNLGIAITVNAGEIAFTFGDKIKFSTAMVGVVETEIDRLGTFALMRNNDKKPPKVRLWVGGEQPQSGSVIPPRPEISILLEDINGIDVDSFSFMISKNDGPFQQVPTDDYDISRKLISVPVRYTPILYIGKYIYHISIRDLNDNITGTEDKPYAEFTFFVEEQPDLTPPQIQIHLNDGALLSDGDVLNYQPQFDIQIADEHGLKPYSIMLWFGKVGEKFQQLQAGEDYKFSFTKTDPTHANLSFAPDLENGEYQIQVEAWDTSKNRSYLGGDDPSPYRFTLDEDVQIDDIINAPNPFERDTVFTYDLTQEPDDVTIKIYTVSGRLIRTFQNASARRGYNEEYWDGRDEDGNMLANGVYLYKIIVKTEGKRLERYGKLAVLR